MKPWQLMIRLRMKSCNNILLSKKNKKISALTSSKIYNYEYLSGEEILPSNQTQIIQQVKLL